MANIKLELPKDANAADGFLILNAHDLQEFIETLRELRLIPRPQPDQPVQSAQHLEDMRRIAFSQLSVDHAQGISAVEKGAEIVLQSMRRSGQITSPDIDTDPEESVFNLNDGLDMPELDGGPAYPEEIVARGEKMREQHGLASIDEVIDKR